MDGRARVERAAWTAFCQVCAALGGRFQFARALSPEGWASLIALITCAVGMCWRRPLERPGAIPFGRICTTILRSDVPRDVFLRVALSIAALGVIGGVAGRAFAQAATPTFTKAFSPTAIVVGASTTLTFTITNNDTTLSLSGLAFTDGLPSGLV